MRFPSPGGIVLAAVLLGCNGSPTAPAPLPVSELRAAPTVAIVAGAPLRLDPDLWRDFMPIAPSDGRPLIAVLRVTPADDAAVPAQVHADAAWVVFGDQVWATRVAEERPRKATAPAYEVVARDGPKWGPGVSVDVVVRLRDGAGHAALLRAPGQRIHRTE